MGIRISWNMSKLPPVQWAQRTDKVFLTLDLVDVAEPNVTYTEEGGITFSGKANGSDYNWETDLFGAVNVEESKWQSTGRKVEILILKKEAEWWDRLLKKSGKNNHIKTDFDKWVDEDEEDEVADDGMGQFRGPGGMDLSSMMGGMGGMGGGGMPGMEGMDMEAMMKQMGGAGGMGGMGGMGGEDDEVDSDDEDLPDL